MNRQVGFIFFEVLLGLFVITSIITADLLLQQYALTKIMQSKTKLHERG